MKIIFSFKDPDAVGDAIWDAVEEEMSKLPGLDDEKWEEIEEIRRKKISDIVSKFFEYGEYCRVEIDTKTKTAKVIPVNE